MATDCTCIILRTASRKVTALYDEALAPHGITLAQYSLLRRIRRAGGTSLTDLAKGAELDRSTVGRNVRLLERLGLVEFDIGEDQRETSIGLTETGHRRLAACEAPWNAAQQAIEAKIGSDGLAALQALAASL